MKNYKFVTGTLSLSMAILVAAGSFASVEPEALETPSVNSITKNVENNEVVELSALDFDSLSSSGSISDMTINFNGKSAVIKSAKNKTKSNKTKVKSKKRKTKAAQRIKAKKKKEQKKQQEEKKETLKSLGVYKITAYCPCAHCCGKSTGITASGTKATAGRTIAADTSVLPFGTEVVIDGHTYTVEDRGGAIKSNKIDIFFNSHQEALNFGVKYIEVFVVEK